MLKFDNYVPAQLLQGQVILNSKLINTHFGRLNLEPFRIIHSKHETKNNKNTESKKIVRVTKTELGTAPMFRKYSPVS